ncbi:MAG: Kiwa anti-phage protein KwaB-like domain-containing protein [Candidatus Lutacidiplasmatales archaeon]
MTVEDTFRNLVRVQKLDASVFLLLGDEPDAEGITRYRRGELGEPLQAAFRRLLVEDSVSRAKKEANRPHTLTAYEPGWRPDRGSHEIQYIDLAVDPRIRRILERFPDTADLADLAPFSANDAKKEAPASFVLSTMLPTGERVRYFHRITSKLALVERNKLVAGLVGTHFSKLKGVTFVFDPKFSCVQVDQYLFLFSPKAFEKLFNYFHGLRERGKDTVAKIGPLITADTREAFKAEALRSKVSLRRLVSVERMIETHPLTIDDFARTIKNFKLPIKIVGKGKDRRLKYEPQELGRLLKLLADDYVRGESSHLPYESNSKRLYGPP